MPFIVKKTIHGNDYYYLRYSFQAQGKRTTMEMSIGSWVPSPDEFKNLNEKFIVKIVDKRWSPTMERIKRNYQRHMSQFGEESIENHVETFGVRFTYDTNRIEGSTLNYSAVKGILLHDLSPGDKPLNDIDEARSHMVVFKSILSNDEDLSIPLLLKWHAELFGVSKPRIAGSIRHARVSILGSEHEPPATHDEVVRELNRLFAWYEDSKDTMHPVLLACLMKFRFVSIHPFEDGNGRISRLIMNHVLYHAGYPMFNIEYITRKGYYESLEVANKKRDEMAFVRWFFTRDIKANKDFA